MQFLKDMILLNPKDFGSADIPIGLILLCFAVGMIFATVIVQIANATVYRTLKALIRHKCTDEESAKTLKELKLSGDRLIAFAIKRENPILMRYLSVASEKASVPTPKNADAIEAADAPEMAEILISAEKEAGISTKEAPSAQNGVVPAEGKSAPEALTEAKYYVRETWIDRAKEILSRGEVGILQTAGLCGLLLVLYFAFAALATWLLPMLF